MLKTFVHKLQPVSLVILTLALLFAGIWLRSHLVSDSLHYTLFPAYDCTFEATGGDLVWSRTRRWFVPTGMAFPDPDRYFKSIQWKSKPFDFQDPFAHYEFRSRLTLMGIETATAENFERMIEGEQYGTLIRVQYWRGSILWIAAPLTILSLILILPKTQVRSRSPAQRNPRCPLVRSS